MLILTVATLYLFFTLRSTSKLLAQQQKDLQAVRDLAQDGRLSSLETTRTGSKVSSSVRDERLTSLEDSQTGSRSGAAGMMIEITRLESRIASLEKPRPMVVPLVQVVVTKKPTDVHVTRANPFGDVHAVIDVEGIGPDYADLLNAAGIYNTRQLWEADVEQVAAAIQAPVLTVDKWQQMCELIAIKGIGPQYAELLVRSGVKTIAQLRDSDETELVASVTKTQASVGPRIQGNTIGHASVGNWIRAARGHTAVPTGQTFSGTAK
jgi:predicted flap endonuclease-1-like 5' DNA nuclease